MASPLCKGTCSDPCSFHFLNLPKYISRPIPDNLFFHFHSSHFSISERVCFARVRPPVQQRCRCYPLAATFSMATFRKVRIHYHRKAGDYDSWGLHVWGDTETSTKWESPLAPSGFDDFGAFWDVSLYHDGHIQFILHQGDSKDCDGSLSGKEAQELWLVSGNLEIFQVKPDPQRLPKGNIRLARAYWVRRDIIAWPEAVDNAEFFLHASKSAHLQLSGNGVEGSDYVIKLEGSLKEHPREVVDKFPHLRSYCFIKVPSLTNIHELLKCQLLLSVKSVLDGNPLDASGVQISGILDDLFAYDGPLGPVYTEQGVNLHLWAPTAQGVKLLIYSTPIGGAAELTLDLSEKNGVWSIQGPRSWNRKFYLFEITVFHPLTQKVEISLANDPYSRGLSANGCRSLLVNLNDPETQPRDWTKLAFEKPQLRSFIDMSIYELHIRDFSVSDDCVDPALQGTYLAFASEASKGMKHLKQLANAGLTHVHLLPSFDFSSVDEIKANWKSVDNEKLAKLPPDSEEQQSAVVAIQHEDGYNWGYDPVNWGVPEGSYATDPNTLARYIEFRQMIQALNRIGLRVILDVVYNHLSASGPHGRYSVLDKVVPGYYLRRNSDGQVENSTCTNNTASEHYMVDRLIIDDLKHWAVDYKVDGFRFDLMGHLMKRTMVRAREVLGGLSKDHDGIDGSKIYLYGEGWDFGEVAGNGRGENASQMNMSGTRIGSFNDRIRDSTIGGSPFSDPRKQGFITGLNLEPNGFDQGGDEFTKHALAASLDWVRLGLVGNLKAFTFINHLGKEVRGSEVLTHDNRPVAYADHPEETINYMSAHDNETLFDIIMLKVAQHVTLQERCRINSLASSIVALSQGIPFFHAGDDILRSKSLDRDSYNSGDWFNRLDFTYESNNWGVGLPPKEKNGNHWDIMRSLLSDKNLRVDRKQILLAKENFEMFLRIRFSSPLFHLPTTREIQERIKFHNTGPSGTPGVIVLSIQDGTKGQTLQQLDNLYQSIIVVFNACPSAIHINVPYASGKEYILHPIQATSSDEIMRLSNYEKEKQGFHVPGRTTAVFVEPRHA